MVYGLFDMNHWLNTDCLISVYGKNYGKNVCRTKSVQPNPLNTVGVEENERKQTWYFS